MNERRNGGSVVRALAVIVGLILVYLLAYYARLAYIKRQPMVTKDELKKCELFIQNHTCPSFEYKRTVEDKEIFDQIVELCSEHKRFRTIPPESPALLGHFPPMTAVFFENENYRYTFAFYSADGERTSENVDELLPIITITKSVITRKEKSVFYDKVSGWYCYLPQEKYVELFELINMYEGGELV